MYVKFPILMRKIVHAQQFLNFLAEKNLTFFRLLTSIYVLYFFTFEHTLLKKLLFFQSTTKHFPPDNRHTCKDRTTFTTRKIVFGNKTLLHILIHYFLCSKSETSVFNDMVCCVCTSVCMVNL